LQQKQNEEFTMRTKKIVVHLDDEQKKELEHYIRAGKQTARNLTRARILLMASEDRSNEEISKTLGTCLATVYNTINRYNKEGLKFTLKGNASPGKPTKINGKVEATMVAIACSKAPEGHDHWTMQLIADKLVSLEVIESVSDETVRRHLKKTKLSLGRKNNGA
jgi:transposase